MSRVTPVVSQILLSLVALLFLVPIIWMLVSALKPSAEVFTVPPKLFGSEVKFSNFVEAWNYLPFGRFILNTLFVAGIGTLITLVASTMSAYAFARLNFRFRGRAVRALPQHAHRSSGGHRYPDVPGHAETRLGELLSGADPALGVHRIRDLPAPAVLPHDPAGAGGSRQDRRLRAHPHPPQRHHPHLGSRYCCLGRLHLHQLLEQLPVAVDHHQRHRSR